jgi:glutathione peroxidase-family protein
MKLLFLYLTTLFLSTPLATSFYDIKFETLDGNVIKTNSYQGKKVVIAVLSADTAGVTLVKYLDSIQKANANIQVIAIPTGDFDGTINVQDLKNLKKNISIVVTKPLKVKKANGYLQHPLFVWLTQAKENSHFEVDVEGEGQVFVVSGQGTLYAVVSKDTPKDILAAIINQPFAQ